MRECSSGKVAYTSMRSAKISATTISTHNGSERRMRAYFCNECGCYHLTSHTFDNGVIYKSLNKYNRSKTNKSWNRFMNECM